jgi:hypothetical protein
MKGRSDFLAWLRREGARRESFHHETLEDLASRAMGWKKPWRFIPP